MTPHAQSGPDGSEGGDLTIFVSTFLVVLALLAVPIERDGARDAAKTGLPARQEGARRVVLAPESLFIGTTSALRAGAGETLIAAAQAMPAGALSLFVADPQLGAPARGLAYARLLQLSRLAHEAGIATDRPLTIGLRHGSSPRIELDTGTSGGGP